MSRQGAAACCGGGGCSCGRPSGKAGGVQRGCSLRVRRHPPPGILSCQCAHPACGTDHPPACATLSHVLSADATVASSPLATRRASPRSSRRLRRLPPARPRPRPPCCARRTACNSCSERWHSTWTPLCSGENTSWLNRISWWCRMPVKAKLRQPDLWLWCSSWAGRAVPCMGSLTARISFCSVCLMLGTCARASPFVVNRALCAIGRRGHLC